ncbi:Uncharacterised protein [uncultured archaeon]|nr:Uncharacterised protein [uncultured archaeon]
MQAVSNDGGAPCCKLGRQRCRIKMVPNGSHLFLSWMGVPSISDASSWVIVANDPYILQVTDFLEYHLFSPFVVSARSSIISTYCLTKDLLISSSEAIFSVGIPSP